MQLLLQLQLQLLVASVGYGLVQLPASEPANHMQVPIALEQESDIITGLYGLSEDPGFGKINILDIRGNVKWTWNASHAAQAPSSDLARYLMGGAYRAVTEIKGFSNGTKIAALYGDAAVIINHTPEDPEQDKRVVWGVNTDGALGPTHTLEALPENWLAIATTGQSLKTDGIWVYDTSAGVTDSAQPVQKITGLPAIHAMIWDEKEQLLWAVGMNNSANGEERAYGRLNAYKFHPMRGLEPLDEKPLHSYLMPNTSRCTTEYGKSDPDGLAKYWDGPHDLVPIPGQRKFLIPSELDINAFDLSQQRYTRGQGVASSYLPGFVPVDNRTGTTPDNRTEEIPRSDLKSVGVSPSGTGLYVQARWQTSFGSCVNVLKDQKRSIISDGHTIYRARWFASIPGWPKAMWPSKDS